MCTVLRNKLSIPMALTIHALEGQVIQVTQHTSQPTTSMIEKILTGILISHTTHHQATAPNSFCSSHPLFLINPISFAELKKLDAETQQHSQQNIAQTERIHTPLHQHQSTFLIHPRTPQCPTKSPSPPPANPNSTPSHPHTQPPHRASTSPTPPHCLAPYTRLR
jgi:hypothetical protein